MSPATAAPGRLRAVDVEDLPGQAPDDSLEDLLAKCPELADEAWLAAHDPDWADDAGWAARPDDLAGDLLADDGWLDGDPGPQPGPREVLKAGFWDRSCGDGAGFAAGGVLDTLPPGPALAGLARDAWADGLDRLSDDELIGVLRAARRLASWAAALELAAVGDLWRRRVAEEDAGDTGVAGHADDEVAAALTLTSHAAGRVLDLALGLERLPLTSAALAAGAIDLPRAAVVASEVTGLGHQHVAAVDRAVAAAAPGQTTGQLRAATRRAVFAADPAAASRRKEEALAEARVERWNESAGTAALAGRDLPPADVLAADQHLTTLAGHLKDAGVPGALDTLRASVYLALLSGIPVSSLLPATADATTRRGSGRPSADTGPGAATPPGGPIPGECPGAVPDGLRTHGTAGGLTARGSVHLTLPLGTWLGHCDTPGQVAGFGPVDAKDARDLARGLAARPGTNWCVTLTDRDGHPVAHGCSHAGPSPGRRRARSDDRPRAGPTIRARDGTWTFTMTVLDGGGCDHAWETPAYRAPAALRHLVQIRHATCTFPGCRRPAAQCDEDHTVAYDDGGRTCLCNLANLCRHHHQVKQTPGWHLEQTSPGVMTWTTPAGRRYTVTPTEYPS